jgi:D-alanyl-D-alanine dipeptidase
MKKVILILLILFSYSWTFAASTPQELLSNSQQLIIVTTPDWDAVSGEMRLYTRKSTQHSWKTVGKPIPVVIGKHGMGWDLHFKNKQDQYVIKHEGDGRTPVGIYAIGPTFGFDEKTSNKTDYFPLTDASVCVDDVKSVYYNQLIDSAKVPQKDWNSGEQMRQVPQYKYGSVVQYNPTPVTLGAGSCIFMHIWKGPTSGTAGCVAMEEPNLITALSWLNGRKNPVIAIFPMEIYKSIKSEWKLPTV